jgi:hypothetical protein
MSTGTDWALVALFHVVVITWAIVGARKEIEDER